MDLRAIAMGLAFAAMWSSAFTSARVIVEYAPPLASLALRFLVSGGIGIGLALVLGQSMRLTRAQWRATVVFGLCQNALYLGLNFVAMQWIEASLAAVIASTMPLVVAVIAWAVMGDKPRRMGAVGLLAGVAGVVLILGDRIGGGVDLTGVAFCVIGVISLAVATLMVRGAASGGNLLMVVGLQMLIGSALLWPIALATETLVIDWSWQLVLAFAYTTLVPGLLATWVWFVLVGRIGAVRAATFHFLNPVFGAAVASVLLRESLSRWDLFGIAVVTMGILLVQLSKQTAR